MESDRNQADVRQTSPRPASETTGGKMLGGDASPYCMFVSASLWSAYFFLHPGFEINITLAFWPPLPPLPAPPPRPPPTSHEQNLCLARWLFSDPRHCVSSCKRKTSARATILLFLRLGQVNARSEQLSLPIAPCIHLVRALFWLGLFKHLFAKLNDPSLKQRAPAFFELAPLCMQPSHEREDEIEAGMRPSQSWGGKRRARRKNSRPAVRFWHSRRAKAACLHICSEAMRKGLMQLRPLVEANS